MKISINFCGIYPGLITANETIGGCEVIGAEFVTCKNDLTKRANMRSDIEDSMVDIRLEFENEDDDCDIYEDRHRFIYDFVNVLAEEGITFDQFVITCNLLDDGRHSYHILASVLDEGGYNIDLRNIGQICQYAGDVFIVVDELCDRSVTVDGVNAADSNMVLNPYPSKMNLYAGHNPLCHELVLPYRSAILADLKQKLFG